MKKIKVAHILQSVGGVDVYLRLVLNNIDDTKFDNVIIHSIGDSNKPFVTGNGALLKSYRISLYRNISLFKDISAIIQAYKAVKKEKPNIIHAHSAKGGVVGRIVGLLSGIPVLYTPHAFSYLSTNSGLKRKVFLFIEKLLKAGKSYVLATSQSEAQRAINEVGFDKKKVFLFNNSIEPINGIEPLSIHKVWPDNYICTVGRPSYQKNTELLVRVIDEIKKHTDIHLVIMGVGHHYDDLDKIELLIDTLQLRDNITLLDWTSRNDVFNIIKNGLVYVSTSRYEGLPYSVIEAMALAKACVVSNCDGNKDLIKNDYNGFVINGENRKDYREKIIELLGNNTLREKFSFNSKASFDANYNIHKNIQGLEAIYTSLS